MKVDTVHSCACLSMFTLFTNLLQVRINYDDAFRYLNFLYSLLERDADVNSENQFGETPLHQACFKGSELSVMWLIKNKADVDHRTKYSHSFVRAKEED